MHTNKSPRISNMTRDISAENKKELRLKLAALEGRLGSHLISALILNDTHAVIEIAA